MPINFVETNPKTIEEAVDLIINNLDNEEIQHIKNDDAELSSAHFFFGMAMRNGWGLWRDSDLAKHFKDVWGLGHADDMSGMILYGVYEKVYDGTPNYKEKAEYYKNYWLDKGIDPLTQEEIKQ